MPTEQQAEFRKRVQTLAKEIPHAKLAEKLGVKLYLLRNWIYANMPNQWTVKALGPKLDALWRKRI